MRYFSSTPSHQVTGPGKPETSQRHAEIDIFSEWSLDDLDRLESLQRSSYRSNPEVFKSNANMRMRQLQ